MIVSDQWAGAAEEWGCSPSLPRTISADVASRRPGRNHDYQVTVVLSRAERTETVEEICGWDIHRPDELADGTGRWEVSP